jgi:hypothetical protein
MIYYPVPLHLQGLYASLGYGEGSPSTGSGRCLPVSEVVSQEVLSMEVLVLREGVYVLLGKWGVGERACSELLEGFEMAVEEVFRS